MPKLIQLPLEIELAILDLLQDYKSTFHACTLVCRTWRPYVQAILLRQITVEASESNGELALFQVAVSTSASLTSSLKALTITGETSLPSDRPRIRPQLIHDLVAALPSLRSLSLDYAIYIDGHITPPHDLSSRPSLDFLGLSTGKYIIHNEDEMRAILSPIFIFSHIKVLRIHVTATSSGVSPSTLDMKPLAGPAVAIGQLELFSYRIPWLSLLYNLISEVNRRFEPVHTLVASIDGPPHLIAEFNGFLHAVGPDLRCLKLDENVLWYDITGCEKLERLIVNSPEELVLFVLNWLASTRGLRALRRIVVRTRVGSPYQISQAASLARVQETIARFPSLQAFVLDLVWECRTPVFDLTDGNPELQGGVVEIKVNSANDAPDWTQLV